MGKYCILDDPAADQTVQSVLDMVAEEIISLMGKHIQAIVLMGGFGRGEGGVCWSERERGYHLVNDLDLAVFVEEQFRYIKKEFTPRLKSLAAALQPKAKGIKQIDVDITNIRRYRIVPNLVSYYEMKYGHKLLYGDLDLNASMPSLKAENLPFFDGTIYFFSRGSGLLLPMLYLAKDSAVSEQFHENFQIELQKACQAMGDALLLKARRYHVSYQERLKRFRQLAETNNYIPHELYAKISPWYEWAATRKLVPKLEWLGEKEMTRRLYEIRDVFGDFFLWFESQRLNKAFTDWPEYSRYILKRGIRQPWNMTTRELLKEAIERKRIILKTKMARLLPVMPLLLFGHGEAGSKDIYLELASNTMSMWSQKPESSDWIDLARAYLKQWHPGGVVATALKL